MLLGFDWGAWYGVLLAIAGAIATVGGAVAVVVGGSRCFSRRIRPEPRRSPDVVLGHPGAQISLTPLHELADGEHRRLVSVKPTYLIENKDPLRSVTQVSTGSRTRDGAHEYVFAEFHAPSMSGSAQLIELEPHPGGHELRASISTTRYAAADLRPDPAPYERLAATGRP